MCDPTSVRSSASRHGAPHDHGRRGGNRSRLALVNSKESIVSWLIAAVPKLALEREQFSFQMKPKLRHSWSSTFPKPSLSVSVQQVFETCQLCPDTIDACHAVG